MGSEVEVNGLPSLFDVLYTMMMMAANTYMYNVDVCIVQIFWHELMQWKPHVGV